MQRKIMIRGGVAVLLAASAALTGLMATSASADVSVGGNLVVFGRINPDVRLSPSGLTPVPSDLGPVRSVAVDVKCTLVVQRDGRVVGWGSLSSGSYGQCPSTPPTSWPLVSVALSGNLALGITTAGRVVGWGQAPEDPRMPPPGLPMIKSIVHIGSTAVWALDGRGNVVTWGDVSDEWKQPAGIAGPFRSASVGGSGVLAVRPNGTWVRWGPQDPAMVMPSDLGPVQAMAQACALAVAVKTDGTVVHWGPLNGCGYPGMTWPSNVGKIRALVAGNSHFLALTSDFTVVPMGHGTDGEATVPSALAGKRVVAVAAGPWTSAAVTCTPGPGGCAAG